MELTDSRRSAEAGSQGLNRGNSPHEFPIIQSGDNLLVDAKLLHKSLGSGYHFYDWIKIRIADFGFVEGQDYLTEKTVKLGKGKPGVNYHITLDMAKELAMLERSEAGRFYRRYFIQKEKELVTLKRQTLIASPTALFQGLRPEKINGRKLWPYKEVASRIGLSMSCGTLYGRIQRMPQHFVKMGERQYITEEFARHLAAQKAVADNRKVIKEMSPVLALDFSKA